MAVEENMQSDASLTWADGIGQKLRQRRRVKRLSLSNVSEKAGLSIALLSQIERGLSTPSLRSLDQICTALDMPMLWLFDRNEKSNPDEDAIVVRYSQRRRMNLGSGGMVKEILSPDTVSQLQLMRFVIHPGGTSGNSPYLHPSGAKCGTVLAGRLGIEIDGQEYILNPNDSFAFHASSPYRFWAVGDVDCELIWAVTPALY
jgi:transcriptional regulator with XRE-family HTH domain